MASTADFKNGLVLKEEGQLWQIVEFQHVKPGKGPAFVRTKLKNVVTGKNVDKTFSAGVKVEPGDSLLGIARRTGVSVADLRAANGLSGDNIRIGQTLVVPGGSAPPASNTRVASVSS